MPGKASSRYQIDYGRLLAGREHCSTQQKAEMLLKQLPDLWRAAYLKMTPRQTEIFFVRHGSFQYMFDHPMHAAPSVASSQPACESRLVVAFGWSKRQLGGRDDFRLKGWVGPTEKTFGLEWDKGHFIGHSIGGTVDQCELNVFMQRRDLNRGWSPSGKRYRRLERYCFRNPGTFCFSRPIYLDGSSMPAMLEFGILKTTGELVVELFDNS